MCAASNGIYTLGPITHRVHQHHRIIATIRIHIEADHVTVGIHIPIRIQESSPLGIIVSRLQIVQPRIGVVVVATITERIICPDNASFRHGNVGFRGDSEISPCVVGIGSPDTILVTDGKDTTLEITPDLYSTLSGEKTTRNIIWGTSSILFYHNSSVM